MKENVRWFFQRLTVSLATIAGLALVESPAGGGYCYTPSYSGYASYSQPYYSYYPQYVAYPVASYVGIPIPVFGSVYVGPNGATNVTTTTTTARTAVATSTQAVATGAATAGASTAAVDSSAEILSTLKTLTSLVGQVAQKQESHASRLSALEGRLVKMEARISRGGVAPAEVSPPVPRKEEGGEIALPAFYASKCFACHQEGSPDLVKNKTTKADIVLFTKTGKRAPFLMDADKGLDQAQAMLTHITDGTMPPAAPKTADGKRKYPELTPAEQTQGIIDIKNFPRRKS